MCNYTNCYNKKCIYNLCSILPVHIVMVIMIVNFLCNFVHYDIALNLLPTAELMFGYLAIHMPIFMQLSGTLVLSATRWAMCPTVSICRISREISLLNYDSMYLYNYVSIYLSTRNKEPLPPHQCME